MALTRDFKEGTANEIVIDVNKLIELHQDLLSLRDELLNKKDKTIEEKKLLLETIEVTLQYFTIREIPMRLDPKE